MDDIDFEFLVNGQDVKLKIGTPDIVFLNFGAGYSTISTETLTNYTIYGGLEHYKMRSKMSEFI